MKIESSTNLDKNKNSSANNQTEQSANESNNLKDLSDSKDDSKNDVKDDDSKSDTKNLKNKKDTIDFKESKNSNVSKTEVQQSTDSLNRNAKNKLEIKLNLANKTKCNEWEDYHEKLLRVLKKEVKQIMEEAVTKKFVHEESSSITSLCAAIDACLSHGLKRRALGLFKTNSTTALLQKTAKNLESASKIYKIVMDLERTLPKGSSSSDSLNKFRLSLGKQTSTSSSTNNTLSNVNINGTQVSSAPQTRYLWIRIALLEKHLYNIVEHLVSNASMYYEKEALVADPVGGQILADLLIGPCTLDYSKMRCQDHIYSDPSADELVLRHNLISSPSSSSTSSPLTKTSCNSLRKAPLYLPYYKWFNFINSSSSTGSNDTNSSLTQSVDNHIDEQILNGGSPVHTTLSQRLSLSSPFSPKIKEYVESLHQNCKSTLLYGKNNVYVQPLDYAEAMPGYLSLHQSSNSLEIRWTPNQLIKGKKADKEEEKEDNSIFWDYCINIFVEDTVYLHCHQGGLAVFIGYDGVQKPSIRFPKGSHLLAFLTCLEAGLVQLHGQLDPPLGLQKGKGKVFPLIKRRTKSKSNKNKNSDKNTESEDNNTESEDKNNEDELKNDYVFRIIINSLKPESISEEMFNPKSTKSINDLQSSNSSYQPKQKPCFRQKLISTSSNSSTNSSKSLNEEFNSASTTSSSSIQTVCETMKHQIISRAFYGWLAYCRHLKTVRTHLSGLVNSEITNSEDQKLHKGLTEQQWIDLHDESGRIKDVNYFFKLVYFGTCKPILRPEVWPYLLGHYDFNLTKEEREQQDGEMRQNYELLMSEWSSVEAIVKIRDREHLTASLAKFNSEEHKTLNQINGSIEKDQSDDVFNNKENDKLDDLKSSRSPSKKKSSEKTSNNFLIEKLLNDVIEEDENCEECKFDEVEENDNESKTNENRCSSSLKLNSLKRQKNIYTQSSTQSNTAPYATNQILITNASVDLCKNSLLEVTPNDNLPEEEQENNETSQYLGRTNLDSRNDGQLSADHSTCVSPASSNGGVYTNELLDVFSLNMHRIDKDVQRCDRNYSFFMNDKNLEKLRNIICTYVWKNLSNGYVQGMCDLVAPLLVILQDEMITYSCFCELMKRMSANFPYSGMNAIDNMDIHFANMRSLIQILDPELFELMHMHSNGDYTHFYFCYRWFLLDFKREFNYEDCFKVWEVIWASKNVATGNMVLFIALALVQEYREIILGNLMDFTDIIKFFNEMAEHHNVDSILANARKLVFSIQSLIN